MNIQFKMQTEKSFEEAVSSIKESLKNYQFGVLWELDFKDKLKEKGLEFEGNFKVLEACNPSKAKAVLEHDIEAGYFLPCKMVVYEKESIVYIGMLKPTSLIDMIGNESLQSIAKEVEDALTKAIKEAIV